LFGKPKILTEVISPTGAYTKKFPIEGNKIVIKPPRRGPGGAAILAEFNRDCIIPYWRGWGPFKRLHHKLLLIEGADKCVSFRFNGEMYEIEKPIWDRETAERFFKAQVIKAAGATIQKVKIPTLLYIMLFLLIVLQFITFLIVSGEVRVAL